jgi:hypothetical protein
MTPAEVGLSDGHVRSEDVADAAGNFVVSGLARGELFLNTLDDRFVALSMPTVPAGSQNIEVVVVPALHVTLVVQTNRSGPLDSFSTVIQIGSPSTDASFGPPFSFTGTRGRAEVWIGQDHELADIESIRLRVSAPGCTDYRGDHPVEHDKVHLQIQLDPEPEELVPLVLVDRDGKSVADLRVEYAAPRDAGFRSVAVTRVDGVPHASLPPGLWQLRIRGSQQFPVAPAFVTTVEIIRSRPVPVVGTLTGGPTLTIDLRSLPGQAGAKTIEFSSSKGVLRLDRVDSQPGLVVWHSMPKATWEIRIWPGGEGSMAKTITIADDDAWVTFP